VVTSSCERVISGGRCDRAFDARDGDVEIIEGAYRNHAGDAALWRIGIDVVEAFEVGRIFDVPEQRQRMAPDHFSGCSLRKTDVD